jgi:hypothetical protein
MPFQKNHRLVVDQSALRAVIRLQPHLLAPGGNTLTGNNGGPTKLNLFFGLDATMEMTDFNPAVGEQFINC